MKRKWTEHTAHIFNCFVLLLLVLSAGGHIVAGDEETMFQVTQNLLASRGLAISRDEIVLPAQDYPGFLPRQDGTLLTTSAVHGKDGKFYSKYSIGSSMAAIPLYLFGILLARLNSVYPEQDGARLAVSMLNPLALTGCGILLARLGQEMGYRKSTARWLALAAVFSTFAWPYVKTFYPQPGVAFFLLFIVYSSYRWKRDENPAWLWLAGLGCAGLILFRASEIVALPAVFLYLTFGMKRERRCRWLVPMGVGTLTGLSLTALYNWLRFGSFLSTGYTEVTWTTPLLFGLFGLLVSPGKGVLWYAPVLILSLGAWRIFAKQHRAESWLIAGISLSFLFLYAPYKFWTGGWNWGPRFLLPVVPLAILPIGAFLEAKGSRLAWITFLAFFSLGFFIQLPAVVVDHSRYLYESVIENDDPNAYAWTIIDPERSPLWNQWPAALDVIRIYQKPEGWNAAANSLAALGEMGKSQGSINGSALLESEFYRLNTIDFWWLHPKLSNPE